MAAAAASVLLVVALSLFSVVLADGEDKRMAACKRSGWVFLPDIQQQSWQAIMNCEALREPWRLCDKMPDCVGFTINGNTGTGWLYRLPRVKQCGLLDSLQSLQWEWPWKWVPMKCKDRGPCCGTYISTAASSKATIKLKCKDGNAAQDGTERDCTCPNVYSTHEYSGLREFELDCQKQQAMANGTLARPPSERARDELAVLPQSAEPKGL